MGRTSRRCAPRSMQPGNGRARPPRLPRPARLVGSAEAVLHPRLAPQRSARPMCRGCSFGSTQIVANVNVLTILFSALSSKCSSSFFVAEITADNLAELAALMKDGRLRSVIDRRYPLAQAAEAMAYLESGRARGKVLVEIP